MDLFFCLTGRDSLVLRGQSDRTGPGSRRRVVVARGAVAAGGTDGERICLLVCRRVNLASNPHPQSQH